MNQALSLNTQAILLLTAPLIVGRGEQTFDLLKPSEYKRLALHLREIQRQPADLLSSDPTEILRACQPVMDEDRLRSLLGRGFQLSQAIERWTARAIWVISRADAEYPRRLKTRLRENAPAVLYGCGDLALLETGGLAVVGSRNVDEEITEYAISVGYLAAQAGRTLVSGGAKGIDQAAMRGALEGGGKACGVLANSLEKAALNRVHRNHVLDGQLLLISPYDPSAGFSVGNAMQRNKLIYALADTSLVVNADLNKGGTWAGAVEQLDKLNFVPVFIRSSGESSAGLDGLRKKGALPWPNPQDVDSFANVFKVAMPAPMTPMLCDVAPAPQTESKPMVSEEPSPSTSALVAPLDEPNASPQMDSTPAEILFTAVRTSIQQLLCTPMKDAEVSAALNVSRAQAKAWLQRLVDEGSIEKQSKPVQYVTRRPDLFLH